MTDSSSNPKPETPASPESPTAESRPEYGRQYRDAAEASRIYLLPNALTAGNLFFGFLACIRCIQANYVATGETVAVYYTQAVWCILGAVICDALDGRVARMGGRESLFGLEFDSLADVISFGITPALMVFFLILSPQEGYAFFQQIGWLIGFVYLLCAAVRLARFNVLTHPLLPATDQLKGTKDFLGLPVPAAAGMIASLVLLLIAYELPVWVRMLLPAFMVLIACLMVSNVHYPSFKNIDWHTRLRFRAFIAIFAVVASAFLFQEMALSLIFATYIFYGLIRHIRNARREGKSIASALGTAGE
ncbi:MAG: CDP-diacylglycerol--serine O-phosphatidyltransferase [Opitutales bacterium]